MNRESRFKGKKKEKGRAKIGCRLKKIRRGRRRKSSIGSEDLTVWPVKGSKRDWSLVQNSAPNIRTHSHSSLLVFLSMALRIELAILGTRNIQQQHQPGRGLMNVKLESKKNLRCLRKVGKEVGDGQDECEERGEMVIG